MPQCCSSLMETFAVDRFDFRLDGQCWEDAYATPTCSCCSPGCLFCTRLIIAVTWLSCVIWSLLDWAGKFEMKYWFTKLTHLTAVLQLAYFVLAAFTTYMAVYSSRERGTTGATPWFVRATWFLFSFVPVLSFMVFVLAWLLLYSGGAVKALDAVMHGGNFALVVLDFLIIRQPFYYAHIYMPIVMGFIYSIFTLVYYQAGGTHQDGTSPWIYKVIDWSEDASGTTNLLGLTVLVGVPITYSVIFCLCGPCFIKRMYKKNFGSENVEAAAAERNGGEADVAAVVQEAP